MSKAMKLKRPFIITPRLLPGVEVGEAFISIKPECRNAEGRIRWQVYIDHKDWKYDDYSIASGVGDRGPEAIQRGMSVLLSFLSACAESRRYATHRYGDPMRGENSDLFPPHVGEWAEQFSDEIGMLQCEIDEVPGLVTDDE